METDLEIMNGQSQKRGVQFLEAKGGDFERNSEGSSTARSTEHRIENTESLTIELTEWLVARPNMERAYKQVVANKGAPGIDGVGVDELRDYLWQHWGRIKAEILGGTYRPSPVRRVEIPKPNGGARKLGIPTVVDRLIQQALLQILTPIFEPTFSRSSYGFRPRRCAQQAIVQARNYITKGKRWVVDMDLEKFFDRVNHDILMERVRRHIKDERILQLIRGYLRAGIFENGLITGNTEGTPQGGPLSPLLSNIMLTDLDRELEKRGHNFCRYADDCNIYVQSEKAGYRVLKSITRFVEQKLKLKVNLEKSAVGRPWQRKFLGYSFTSRRKTTIRIHKDSIRKLKDKVKTLLRKGRGRNLRSFIRDTLISVLRGWAQYFKYAESYSVTKQIDAWILRRLRILVWRQWSRARVRYRKLIKSGAEQARAFMAAYASRGPYRLSNFAVIREALPWQYFHEQGLISITNIVRQRG